MVADPQRAQQVFLAAAERTSPADRAALLAKECGEDAKLRERVEALLAAHDNPQSFLDIMAASLDVTPETPAVAIGTQIGPYKLLQQIGEGGFGVVYMAEQSEPVRRKVALKILKPGMDSRQVVARFEAERQALAVMDHPNIARVFDAGATESGRSYFVMELVRGTPITQYCDENSLPVRERLELFASVCQAIQHAHTKGIIHRDIKPTNVLVTRQDGQPLVKVIDFGVAKAMGQALTDKTLFTEFAQMIGTPLYMSPEQAELSSTDIDTRSDIYSLGVLLYELLTGTTPVSKEQLKQAAFDEIRRIIREDEPQKPSTRISTAEAAPSIAAQRHTEPAKLTKLVRGELDWIVMKALEKDRNRRYETASGFAKDVQRYLSDEQVQACPPSAGYRLRKFARRNKVALMTTLLVMVALLSGTVISTWQAFRATTAEREAEANLQNAREAVDQMLARVADKRLRDVPQAYPVRQGLLEDALKFYEGFLRQRPGDPQFRLKQMELLRSLGHLQSRMSLYGDADQSLRQAVEIATKLAADQAAPAEHRAAQAMAHQALAGSLALRPSQTGQESNREYRLAIEKWDALLHDFPESPTYRGQKARCQWGLARLLIGAGQPAFDEAEALLRQAIATDRELSDQSPGNSDNAGQLMEDSLSLADLLERKGQLEKAEDVLSQLISDSKRLMDQSAGEESSRRILSKFLLQRGHLLSRLGRQQEGAELALRALEVREGLARDFPEISGHQAWVANVLYTDIGLARLQTQPEQAETAFRRALAIYEHRAGVGQPAPFSLLRRIMECRTHLASSLFALGQREEAESTWRQAMADAEKLVRADPRKGNLIAEVLKAWPEAPAADAEQVYRTTLPLLDWLVEQDPTASLLRQNGNLYRRKLALLYLDSGRPEEAERLWRSAALLYEKVATKYADQPHYGSEVIRAQLDLAVELQDQKRLREAEQVFGPAIQACQMLLTDFPKDTKCREQLARGFGRLGYVLFAASRGEEAEKTCRQSLAVWQALASESPDKANYWFELGQVHTQLKQWTDAETSLTRAIELKPDFAPALHFRGYAYANLGQWDKAIAEQTKSIELDGKFWLSWYRRGLAHAALKQWDNASADYTKAVELGGASDPWFWVNKAAASAQLDEPDQAMADLRQAIAKGFRDAQHLKYRGELDGLRSRDDFKSLLSELEAKK